MDLYINYVCEKKYRPQELDIQENNIPLDFQDLK